ncbi:hypothetical protein MOUN0_L00826 [Monosporozyma unispora]|nr:hypothetical protein C6P44_003045 [Kazachstania unispora]
MAGQEGNYRMLILLEEELEDQTVFDSKDSTGETKQMKSSHEYLDELRLPFAIDELDVLNKWFDKFDEEICIPNEGHIKYEISSDGLIVLMLGKEIESVYETIKKFVAQNQDLE